MGMISRWQGKLPVLGGILIHITLGTSYTFGNMTSYFTSYIRARSSPANLRYSTAMWLYAFTLACFGAFMFVGGLIDRRVGPRWATLIGGSICSLGILLTSLTIQWSFFGCLLTYGALYGAGCGIAYVPPLACAMKWWPKNKGLLNGTVMAGLGSGALIFDQVQTAFINPENLSPDKPLSPNETEEKYFSEENAADLLDRVPTCFLLLGGCYTAFLLLGSILLINPPEEPEKIKQARKSEKESLINQEEYRDKQHSYEAISRDKIDYRYCDKTESVHPKQMIKTKAFYLLWFINVFYGQAAMFVSSLYKTFGQEYSILNDDHFLALVGSLSSVFNALGRIVWGILADKFSFKHLMLAMCTCTIILMMTFILTPQGGKVMYALWICAIVFTFSGVASLISTAIAKAYGPAYVATNIGILLTSLLSSWLYFSMFADLMANIYRHI